MSKAERDASRFAPVEDNRGYPLFQDEREFDEIYGGVLGQKFAAPSPESTHPNDPEDSPWWIPGDFDLDGDVDGADFVIWQTNFGTSSGAEVTDGDGDDDGDVDGADFVIWQSNYPYSPWNW